MVSVWAFLVHLLFVSTALAADFTGQVVRILDGDTIEVLHNTRAERIRLNGIDCPEKGQPYGQEAKQAASDLVLGGRSHASDLRPRQVRAHPCRTQLCSIHSAMRLRNINVL